ncbi:MAG: MFS transporter [Acidobacteriota bacterium]
MNNDSPPSGSTRESATPTNARHIMLGFILSLTAISYLDRVCIAMTAPAMKLDLGLSDAQMGYVFSAFTVAYALFEIPSGWLADRFGPRLMLARVVVWWSVMTVATGFTRGFASLFTVRLLFGLGEAGTFPGTARAFSHWLPARTRARAFGLAVMAATLCGAFTYKLVAVLLQHVSWRQTFYVFGLVGLVWVIAWTWWFRDDPRKHPGVNQAELDLIGMDPPPSHERVPWSILYNRNMIALSVMYLSTVYGWYIYLTWFPTYMLRARGVDLQAAGNFSQWPLYGLALGVVSGGWLSDRIRSVGSLSKARRIPGLVGLPLAALTLLGAIFTPQTSLSVLLFSTSAGLSALAVAPAWAVCLDIGRRRAGVVSGTMNMFGNLGGALSPVVVGLCLDRFGSWNAPLLSVGAFYLLGAVCWMVIDPSRQLEREGSLG